MLPAIIAGATLLASIASERAKAEEARQQKKEDAEATAAQQAVSGYMKQPPRTYSPKALPTTIGSVANVVGTAGAMGSNWMDYQDRQALIAAMQQRNGGAQRGGSQFDMGAALQADPASAWGAPPMQGQQQASPWTLDGRMAQDPEWDLGGSWGR